MASVPEPIILSTAFGELATQRRAAALGGNLRCVSVRTLNGESKNSNGHGNGESSNGCEASERRTVRSSSRWRCCWAELRSYVNNNSNVNTGTFQVRRRWLHRTDETEASLSERHLPGRRRQLDLTWTVDDASLKKFSGQGDGRYALP